MQLHTSILATVGNTPIVRLAKLAPAHVNVYAKLESFNPMGSVKDRLALAVIDDAERRGVLKPGQTVVEATSGNTGIALAMVCAVKGYPLVVTMAENFSVERRKVMRFLGAKVVLTPASLRGSGMIAKAVELANTHGWFLCRQFDNEANAEAHARTTAPEILGAFANKRLDYWVTGAGTGGTLKGVASVLKSQRPETRIVVCEPDNSPMLKLFIAAGGGAAGADAVSTASRPHVMQGWSPDFVPRLTDDAAAAGLIDEIVPVDGAMAMRCARDLARREGIFCGITGGATLAGALQLAERAPAGSNILCMIPDTGDRYLSTPLFADTGADMTAEELDISRSTPSARFDVATSPPTSVATPPSSQDMRVFVDSLIHGPTTPVVMFALAWCEYCWSVRRLFQACSIPFRSVDLDSVEYQDGDRGGRIRAALLEMTGIRTIPQVFIGGRLVGGCTDVFDAFRKGSLQSRLAELSVPFDATARVDPDQLLPAWVHPREQAPASRSR